MTDEADTVAEEGRAVPVNGTQMGLLWQAHALKGCDDHQSDKARISRKFKCRMVTAMVFQPIPGGGFAEQEDPRGNKIFEEKTHMLPLTPAEAENFETLLTELKKKKDPKDGTPVIDATVADEVEDLEKRAFLMWKAKVPGGNGSAPELEAHETPLIESKEPAVTAEGGTDA
jgi:hypothetical protein